MKWVTIGSQCINLDRVCYFSYSIISDMLYIHFEDKFYVGLEVPESCDTLEKCIEYFGINL